VLIENHDKIAIMIRSNYSERHNLSANDMYETKLQKNIKL